jgi:hypothetical protein
MSSGKRFLHTGDFLLASKEADMTSAKRVTQKKKSPYQGKGGIPGRGEPVNGALNC